MDLKSFLAILWRRKLVIGITTVLALMATVAGLSLVTPEYTAGTTLRMGTANTGSSGWVSYDIQYTDRLMNTYSTMVMSKQTSDQVMKQLHLSSPPKISVTIPANTELMEIQVQDPNPQQAAASADAVANNLVSQIEAQYNALGESSLDILKQQIDQTQADLTKAQNDYDNLLKQSPQNTQLINATLQSIQLKESTYSSLLQQYQQMRDATAQGASKMTIVQKATVPTSPSNPNKKLIIPLGLFLGLVSGTGLGFLLENFDTTMHSTDEIVKHAELPLLARIPATSRKPASALFPEKSAQEEAFRRLRTTIFALDPESKIHSLMITSSEPSEGKSTTVANLALAIAQAGRRVIVVDGDLRKPTMQRVFHVSNTIGLSNVLTHQVSLDEAIQYSMIPGIQVLTSGPASANPAELLGLPQMHEVIDQLSNDFDFVLIDAPSLQSVADAPVMSLIVDGVIVVVARGVVRREVVDAALQELASVHRKPLGIVVSHAEPATDFHYDRPPESESSSDERPVRSTETSEQLPVPTLRVINATGDAPVDKTPLATELRRSMAGETMMSRSVDQPRELPKLRRVQDVSRFRVKNGGSLECYDIDQQAVNER